ncbi:hypothetical protein VINI7043_27270 [Vibrio nigripulchritudo ATCC 27043]|nr:hypothetical protein VINI7043_27270 [Vibrio nigripulchritudo ATCC 27043]
MFTSVIGIEIQVLIVDGTRLRGCAVSVQNIIINQEHKHV